MAENKTRKTQASVAWALRRCMITKMVAMTTQSTCAIGRSVHII